MRFFMEKYKLGDIVECTVSGMQKYGIFVNVDNSKYTGLIHISEISYNFVKNLTDYVHVGNKINAKIIDVDEKNKKLKLTIKDFDYHIDKGKKQEINEVGDGFAPIKENLDSWIEDKYKEITGE